MLICLPFTTYAKSDSSKIGISVIITPKQACNYSYALENSTNLNNSSHTQFSVCDISNAKLQQQANQIATAEFETTQSLVDGKHLRVFMTVQ